MEFVILAPRKQSCRELIVKKAVLKVAESLGASLLFERGEVHGTIVYIKRGKSLFMVYNDLNRGWSQGEIRIHIIRSIVSSYVLSTETSAPTVERNEIVKQ